MQKIVGQFSTRLLLDDILYASVYKGIVFHQYSLIYDGIPEDFHNEIALDVETWLACFSRNWLAFVSEALSTQI